MVIERLEARVLLTAGDRDLGFGDRGVLYLEKPKYEPAGVVVQSDGKTVIAGTRTAPGHDPDLFLQRFTVEGVLDPTFGVGGTRVIDVAGYEAWRTLLLTPGDGLVVVGSVTGGTGVVRLTAGGELDGSFAAGGILVSGFRHSAGEYTMTPWSAALLGDGTLVVAGEAYYWDNGSGTVLQRVAPDGSWEGSQRTYYNLSGSNDIALDVDVAPDGSMAILAQTGSLHLIRSGAEGFVKYIPGSNGYYGGALAVQGDGKYVVVEEGKARRFNVDGTPDESFGTAGVALLPGLRGQFGRKMDVEARADGTIVIAGQVDSKFAVIVLTGRGELLTSWADGGMYTAGWSGGESWAADVFIGHGGRVTAVGSAFGQPVVATIWADGYADTRFAGTGLYVGDFRGAELGVNRVLPAAGGGFLVVGSAIGPGGTRDFYVARHNADGTLDATFGTAEGRTFVDFGGASDFVVDAVPLPDGTLALAGHSEFGQFPVEGTRMAVARLSAGGIPVAGFGDGSGKAWIDPIPQPGRNEQVVAADVQSDGRLVIAYAGYGGTAVSSGLVRLTAGGALDSTFNGGAPVVLDGVVDGLSDVVVRTDGRIVASGWRSGAQEVTYIGRTASGGPDGTFGEGGVARVTAIGIVGRSFPLLAMPDGTVMGAGALAAGGFVMRLQGNGRIDTGYGDFGFARVSGERPLLPLNLARDGSGNVLVNFSANVTSPGPAVRSVVRLKPRGESDAGFGRGGRADVELGNVGMTVLTDGDVILLDANDAVLRLDGTPGGPAAPAAPTGLRLRADDALTTTLTWFDNSSNEAGFIVERSPDGVTFEPVALLPANAAGEMSYTDDSFSGSARFDYRVRAANEAGASAASNVVSRVTEYLPIQSGASDDRITLRLDPSGANLLVFLGGGVGPAYVVPVASYGSIVVSTLGGDDTLTIDLANGNPIPAGGMVYEPRELVQPSFNDRPTVPIAHKVHVIGTGVETGHFDPSFTYPPAFLVPYGYYADLHSGVLDVGGRTVRTYRVTRVDVERMASFGVNMPGGGINKLSIEADGATAVSGSLTTNLYSSGYVSVGTPVVGTKDTPLDLVLGGIAYIDSSGGARTVPIRLRGNGTFYVSGATVPLSSPDGRWDLVMSPNGTAPGVVVLQPGLQRLANVVVNAGRLELGAPSTVFAPQLLGVLGDATLDLGEGTLLIDYSTTGGAPYDPSNLLARVQSAYNHGRLDLPGITSSVAKGDANRSMAVAVVDNAVLRYARFSGVEVDESTLIVRAAAYGDANVDGGVSADDVAVMLLAAAGGYAGWAAGDFNMDQRVATSDDWALFSLGAAYHPKAAAVMGSMAGAGVTEEVLGRRAEDLV